MKRNMDRRPLMLLEARQVECPSSFMKTILSVSTDRKAILY